MNRKRTTYSVITRVVCHHGRSCVVKKSENAVLLYSSRKYPKLHQMYSLKQFSLFMGVQLGRSKTCNVRLLQNQEKLGQKMGSRVKKMINSETLIIGLQVEDETEEERMQKLQVKSNINHNKNI